MAAMTREELFDMLERRRRALEVMDPLRQEVDENKAAISILEAKLAELQSYVDAADRAVDALLAALPPGTTIVPSTPPPSSPTGGSSGLATSVSAAQGSSGGDLERRELIAKTAAAVAARLANRSHGAFISSETMREVVKEQGKIARLTDKLFVEILAAGERQSWWVVAEHGIIYGPPGSKEAVAAAMAQLPDPELLELRAQVSSYEATLGGSPDNIAALRAGLTNGVDPHTLGIFDLTLYRDALLKLERGGRAAAQQG